MFPENVELSIFRSGKGMQNASMLVDQVNNVLYCTKWLSDQATCNFLRTLTSFLVLNPNGIGVKYS